jgi:hypothetical protein
LSGLVAIMITALSQNMSIICGRINTKWLFEMSKLVAAGLFIE